ncbi:radical SAM protein, partial [Acinetobacter baumannii]
SPEARALITELQSRGLRLVDPGAGLPSRRGGAGPSDHKAVTIDGHTVMVPVHTAPAFASPFVADAPGADGQSILRHASIPIAQI